jgi:hypothetical protein
MNADIFWDIAYRVSLPTSGWYVPLKHRLTSGPHGVISQQMAIFTLRTRITLVKNTALCPGTPCTVVSAYRNFDKNVLRLSSALTRCLHLQGRSTVNSASRLVFVRENGGSVFPRNVGKRVPNFTRLESQNVVANSELALAPRRLFECRWPRCGSGPDRAKPQTRKSSLSGRSSYINVRHMFTVRPEIHECRKLMKSRVEAGYNTSNVPLVSERVGKGTLVPGGTSAPP